jgi:hypothetical protein
MKPLITFAMLTLFSAMIVGCEASGSVGTDDTKHQTVQEKTVTDPNGNVISHTETKSTDNNPNNPNP